MPSKCSELIENANIISCFPKINSVWQGLYISRSLAASHYSWSREINCEFNGPGWVALKCHSLQSNGIACLRWLSHCYMDQNGSWFVNYKVKIKGLDSRGLMSICKCNLYHTGANTRLFWENLSIPWLQMSWLLASPSHQQTWHWLCRTIRPFILHKQGCQLSVQFQYWEW